MGKTVFYTCEKCDAQFPKWAGRCGSCGAWGSIGQIPQERHESSSSPTPKRGGKTQAFSSDTLLTSATHPTGFAPLDLVLGGGLVEGSVTLLAGEPGAGKSTLTAHVGLSLASQQRNVIYVTGEESPAQIHRRLSRFVPVIPPTFAFLDDTDADTIAATMKEQKPALTIIDSIQTLQTGDATGEPGSPSQVKASASRITTAAKESGTSVLLIGQVTKEGDAAGPRLLEHIVDTVLYLDGDRLRRYRMLRAMKHRFGATDDVALLAMSDVGLTAVEDASAELLRDRPTGVPGSAVTCFLEGHRPMLLEIQSLVAPAGYGTPIRRATGIDSARLGMLLAVLARRAGVFALDKDVYANAAGGIDAKDPSIDLALATAITSAVKDIALDPRIGMFGEIGLAGELRPVSLPDLRLKEMARLGFTHAIVPRHQGNRPPKDMHVQEATTLREALQMMHVI